MPLSPSERRLAAQVGVERSWANTSDRTARTAPARRAALKRFETEVITAAAARGDLPPTGRELALRAEHARKSYMAGLALASAKARRLKRAGGG